MIVAKIILQKSSERDMALAAKRYATSAKEVIGISGWLNMMGIKMEGEEKKEKSHLVCYFEL